MSKPKPTKPPVQSKPTKSTSLLTYVQRFFLCIGSACAISGAIYAFLKLYGPKTRMEICFFAVAAISIYLYGALDTRDKMKKWGLID